MKKLRAYLETWMDGRKVHGISVSLYDIHSCLDVYNAMVRKGKPEFINGKVKEVLDKCGIKVVSCGIGWKVA